MKIPLLNEIHPFDNSVNTYRSNSGYTFENRYSEKPATTLATPLRNIEYSSFDYKPSPI